MRLPALVFLVGLTTVLSRVALGQGATPKPGPISERNAEAAEAASNGKFEQAARLWEGLLDEVPESALPPIHANLAVAYRNLNQLPHSWHHLTWYLKHIEKEDAEAGRELQLLEKDLQAGGFIRIGIACEPADASLHLGRKAEGEKFSCRLAWWFEPGKQWVTASAEGHETRSVDIDVRARGDQTSYTVTLQRSAQAKGELVVEGSGRAIQVFLDGSLEGVVPFHRKLEPGTYELMVGKPGEMPWKKTVVIEAGTTLVEKPPNAQPEMADTKDASGAGTPLVPDDQKPVAGGEAGGKGTHYGRWAWILFGAGAGAAAAGGVLCYLAKSNLSELKHNYWLPEDGGIWKGTYDDGKRLYEAGVNDTVRPERTAAYVLFGVGAASAAAGAVALILSSTGNSDSSSGIEVLPMTTPMGAGLSVTFGF